VNQLLNYDKVSFAWSVRIAAFIQIGILSAGILLLSSRFRHLNDGPPPFAMIFANARYITFTLAALLCYFGLCRLTWYRYVFLFYLPTDSPFFFISDYALSKEISIEKSFYTASILNASSFFGRSIAGLLADLVGVSNVAIFSAAGSSVLLFCWSSCETLRSIVVFSVLYGICSGAVLSTLTPGILRFCPSPKNAGAWGKHIYLSR